MKEVYIETNTPSLRSWLREQGFTPVAYPDSDRPGLTAFYAYGNTGGELWYNDGARYETDDDMKNVIICDSEEEFKQTVLSQLKR